MAYAQKVKEFYEFSNETETTFSFTGTSSNQLLSDGISYIIHAQSLIHRFLIDFAARMQPPRQIKNWFMTT